MPLHDIIDNRENILSSRIAEMLSSSEMARFAVGYLFVSGLAALGPGLKGLKELKLLIGDAGDRETVETLAQRYLDDDAARDALEEIAYPKSAAVRTMVTRNAAHIRAALELTDQNDAAEDFIKTLPALIKEGRIKVRVYKKGRLHAKAYVFDYGPIYDAAGKALVRPEKGVAVVGSSNISLAGLTHNTELNVVVHGNENHAALCKWFDDLWVDGVDFDKAFVDELKQSWALAPVTPYDIYMKTLYELVKDRLEGGEDSSLLWDNEVTARLTSFQHVAVKVATRMIRDWGGAFVADVVGLGKSFIGSAIVKHFEQNDGARPLIICPARLVEMWEQYNEFYHLNARVLSMGMLKEDDGGRGILSDTKYRERDFVLIDESHNFRHEDTQRYKVLQEYLNQGGRRSCLLTATPRNKSAWDIYNQIKLFHPDDKTDLPIDPPNLREYFKLIDKGDKSLPELLTSILYRRRRKDILQWYGFDAETNERVDPKDFAAYEAGAKRAYVKVGDRKQFFPQRKLETVEYSIEETYRGLYQKLRGYIGKGRGDDKGGTSDKELTYARYGLWRYVNPGKREREPYAGLKRAGRNLHGLMRVLLFKRFESSVYAFQETVRRLFEIHNLFLRALDEGIIPAGEGIDKILYESDLDDETAFLDNVRDVSKRYAASDFDIAGLRRDVAHDRDLLAEMMKLVEPIKPAQDAKLQILKKILVRKPLSTGKRLIFTQYADTARYLFENLNPGGKIPEIEVVFSDKGNASNIVGRFAPKANPELTGLAKGPELFTVVSTDVLAEGLNLQDCDKIVNYDLHWNPVRLIQRLGRIDRIGTENEIVYGYNFLPETAIEKNLGLREKLAQRIREIHETIGEDAAILDPTEKINEKAMYAIYEGDVTVTADDQDVSGGFAELNEAEEIFRKMMEEEREEYERIKGLRAGIRVGRKSAQKGTFVFCEAGNYRQLYRLDDKGDVVARDVGGILQVIKCGADEEALPVPRTYNSVVSSVKKEFAIEVKKRNADRQYKAYLSHGQRYVLNELRVIFEHSKSETERDDIAKIEAAVRRPITEAVKRQLNRIRSDGARGKELLRRAKAVYLQHDLGKTEAKSVEEGEEPPVPRIVCGEAWV